MEIIEVGGNGETLRNVSEIAVLGRSNDLDLAVTLGLLDSLLGPDAGIDVTGLATEEVGGDLVEEGAGTAAEVENLVVVGDGKQLAEEPVGLGHDVVEILSTVRNREHRKARTVEIEDGPGGVPDDLLRQNGGSRVEIVLFHRWVCVREFMAVSKLTQRYEKQNTKQINFRENEPPPE